MEVLLFTGEKGETAGILIYSKSDNGLAIHRHCSNDGILYNKAYRLVDGDFQLIVEREPGEQVDVDDVMDDIYCGKI